MEEQPNGTPTGAEDEVYAELLEAAKPVPLVAQADVPEWAAAVDAADSKALRRYPKVAGIIGGEIEQAVRRERARWEGEQARAKAQADETAARQAKLDLARDNPVEFADTYLSEQEERSTKLKDAQAKNDEMNQLADRINVRLADIPEWAEMDAVERHARLAKAFENVQPEDVMAVFVTTTAELLAEAKANKHKNTTLAGERKALRTEVTAEMLANGQYPDLRAASGPGRIDWARLSDKDFDKEYEARYLRR